jgi:hypothetical protein
MNILSEVALAVCSLETEKARFKLIVDEGGPPEIKDALYHVEQALAALYVWHETQGAIKL